MIFIFYCSGTTVVLEEERDKSGENEKDGGFMTPLANQSGSSAVAKANLVVTPQTPVPFGAMEFRTGSTVQFVSGSSSITSTPELPGYRKTTPIYIQELCDEQGMRHFAIRSRWRHEVMAGVGKALSGMEQDQHIVSHVNRAALISTFDIEVTNALRGRIEGVDYSRLKVELCGPESDPGDFIRVASIVNKTKLSHAPDFVGFHRYRDEVYSIINEYCRKQKMRPNIIVTRMKMAADQVDNYDRILGNWVLFLYANGEVSTQKDQFYWSRFAHLL